MELGKVVDVVETRRRAVEVPEELQAPDPTPAEVDEDVTTPRMS
ncbi:MAG: hypothetical protein AAGD18_04585 [Actinomycetota bacterium]